MLLLSGNFVWSSHSGRRLWGGDTVSVVGREKLMDNAMASRRIWWLDHLHHHLLHWPLFSLECEGKNLSSPGWGILHEVYYRCIPLSEFRLSLNRSLCFCSAFRILFFRDFSSAFSNVLGESWQESVNLTSSVFLLVSFDESGRKYPLMALFVFCNSFDFSFRRWLFTYKCEMPNRLTETITAIIVLPKPWWINHIHIVSDIPAGKIRLFISMTLTCTWPNCEPYSISSWIWPEINSLI